MHFTLGLDFSTVLSFSTVLLGFIEKLKSKNGSENSVCGSLQTIAERLRNPESTTVQGPALDQFEFLNSVFGKGHIYMYIFNNS